MEKITTVNTACRTSRERLLQQSRKMQLLLQAAAGKKEMEMERWGRDMMMMMRISVCIRTRWVCVEERRLGLGISLEGLVGVMVAYMFFGLLLFVDE